MLFLLLFSKDDFYFFFFRKSSCSDLQSRLKVRKLLGVGDTAGSKISQILGHSDHLIFQLPPKLTLWLLLTTILFSCFTVMVNIMIIIINPLMLLLFFFSFDRDYFGHPVYNFYYRVISNLPYILLHHMLVRMIC